MNVDLGYIRVEDDQHKRNRYRHSLTRKTGAGLAICEQLRFVYDTVYDSQMTAEEKEKITEQLVDVMIMAKKMQDKLLKYHDTYNDGTGHGGSNINNLQNNGPRRRMRRDRP